MIGASSPSKLNEIKTISRHWWLGSGVCGGYVRASRRIAGDFGVRKQSQDWLEAENNLVMQNATVNIVSISWNEDLVARWG